MFQGKQYVISQIFGRFKGRHKSLRMTKYFINSSGNRFSTEHIPMYKRPAMPGAETRPLQHDCCASDPRSLKLCENHQSKTPWWTGRKWALLIYLGYFRTTLSPAKEYNVYTASRRVSKNVIVKQKTEVSSLPIEQGYRANSGNPVRQESIYSRRRLASEISTNSRANDPAKTTKCVVG